MANAAWAFVRPMELDKGIQAAVAAKAGEDANAVALQNAQNALAFNSQLQPVQLQNAQNALAFNSQLQPVQLQNAQNVLDYTKQLQPLLLQQAQQGAQLNTNKFVDAQSAFASDQLFKAVPLTPGESEESVYKKYLAAATSTQDPMVRNAAAQRLNAMAPQLAIQALNKGDPTSAHNILLAQNNGPLPTYQAFTALQPAQQYAIASNTQLTSQLPNPQVALDNAKTDNEIRLRQVPTGDAVIKETFNQAERQTLSQQDMARGYNQLLLEAQKTGVPLTMTFQQYMALFPTSQSIVRQPGNSVSSTGVPNPTGPGGVPYK